MAFAVKKAVKDKFRRNKRKGEKAGEEVAQNLEEQKDKTAKGALKQENGFLSTKRPDQGRKRQTLPPGAKDRQNRGKGGSQPSMSDQKSSNVQQDGNVEKVQASLDSTEQSAAASSSGSVYDGDGPVACAAGATASVSVTGSGGCAADTSSGSVTGGATADDDAAGDTSGGVTGDAAVAASSVTLTAGAAASCGTVPGPGDAAGGAAGDADADSSGSVAGGGAAAVNVPGDTSSGSVTGCGAAADTSSVTVTAGAAASCGTVPGPGDAAGDADAASSGSVTGGGAAAVNVPGDTSSGSVTGCGAAADVTAASFGSLPGDAAGNVTGLTAGDGAGSEIDGEAGAAAAAAVAAVGNTNVGGDDEALGLLPVEEPENPPEGVVAQSDNSLASVTATPIQEERLETETADPTQNRTPEGAEDLRNEERAAQGDTYEQSFVSNTIQKNKFLEDKLACKLDHTAHRCIRGWEHLACTKEVNAPLETRLRCKLVSRGSCTRTLIDFLAVQEGDKSVQDLIAALKDIKRNDVVKMITDVYPDAEHSTQTISEFVASSDNNDLIEKITTKLDERSRVNACWINLGRKFQISSEKLKEIELCGETNPTEALMEYLYTKREDLTVQKFYEIVKKLKRGDVAKKLEPFLDEANPEKRLWDAIDLESDEMRSICVDLNTQNRALKNWKHLANALEVPRDTYSDFNPQQPKSPTKELLNWIYAEKNDLTVGQLCAALASIGRNDVVRDLKNYFKPPPSEN
ncbi:homeotic protein female sterile-like isoform X1 [Stylophora pistillata]|uniref:homeotic protein female sterile-like isoform X1 n=1 Tax=Stylophora pistillata TaxID=50429 RepID=UPI000C03B179|nr:homeotic protein female sterile-like isoform X1 [Stylophora pistillata]